MKTIVHIIAITVCIFGILACSEKSEDVIINDKGAKDFVEAQDYTFNTATKTFTPQNNIEAQITSQKDINFIYTYLIREGVSDSLVDITYTQDLDSKRSIQYVMEASLFEHIPMQDVSGLKLMIKRTDNSSDEAFINIQSFTPPLPFWENVPESLVPDDANVIQVTATAKSENGITKIELYDDYQGAFVKVHEIDLNGETAYAFDYAYTYRPNAANLKLIMYDAYGLSSEALIAIPVLPYEIYTNVIMSAQGTNAVTFNNNAILLPSFELTGPCNFANKEEAISFFTYATSSGVSLYAPTNTTNIIGNYRCNGSPYAPITSPSNWVATRFRVLLPSNSRQQEVYDAYNTNSIPDLSDDFFDGISTPSSSAPRYSSTAEASASIFTQEAYLIWATIPNPQGTINVLLRIREVIENGNESSIRFDLLVPKN